ncbi:MAG TPA: class I tRNA ligase family protein, partial [Candidatus Hypogeohydataceae bacterium YC40]
ACTQCKGKNLQQDLDVLDTWFSSALWPFSTLGWPEEAPELKTYYPTSVLVTGRDILYFWVARMVMMGLEMLGEEPFGKVYIHGTILDEQGRRMSKSLGNGIDPLEMIERYGTDAVRMSLLLLTTEGQDIKLSETKFGMGRNFTNKIWNAARFVIMQFNQSEIDQPPYPVEGVSMAFEDRWILSRLSNAVTSTTEALEHFKFNEALQTVYDFFWHDLCDWYLEIIKPRLYEPENQADKKSALSTLFNVFHNTLRLLHPFAPFLTEEIWSSVSKKGTILLEENLIIAKWPEAGPKDLEIEKTMELLQELVKAVRNIRRNFNIPDRQSLKAIISSPGVSEAESLKNFSNFLKQRAYLEELAIGLNLVRPDSSASAVVGAFQLFIPLAGIIDVEAEKIRQDKQLHQLEEYLQKVKKKLSSKNFLEKAPPEVVEKEQTKEKELDEQIRRLRLVLAELK